MRLEEFKKSEIKKAEIRIRIPRELKNTLDSLDLNNSLLFEKLLRDFFAKNLPKSKGNKKETNG